MSKKNLLSLLIAVFFILPASVLGETLQTVDFETAGNGYSVTGAISPSASACWDRTDGTVISPTIPFTGKQGSYFFYGENTDYPLNDTAPVYVTLNSINISGYNNLEVKLLVAGNSDSGSGYEGGEYLIVEYSVDGGAFSKLAQYIPSAVDIDYLTEDANADGTPDGANLNTAFTDFTYNIPSSGTTLQLRIKANIDQGGEEVGFDNIRVLGTPIVVENPEINIQGNGNSIADGDSTPSLTDHTDFGTTPVCNTTIVRTFTIQNTGTAVLNISSVNISGTNAADFSVTASPAASVTAAGSTTFQVTLDPSASGTRNAVITVNSDDSDEAAYDFAITGTGTNMAITPASQTNVSCYGGSNGAAAANAATGGTAPYTYNWTPGNPTGDGTTSVTGLPAGTWTIMATDANNCTASTSFTVTQPDVLDMTLASKTDVSVYGGSNGAASFNPATGGVGGYTYNWTPGNPAGDGSVSVTGLVAGTWSCTVTDANSCTLYKEVTIIQPPAVTSSDASSVAADSAILGGNVTANGGGTVTERGIVYSITDTTPEIGDSGVIQDANDSGTGVFSKTISGLDPNKTYYFRAYATNGAGTTYGGIKNFITLKGTPTVNTWPVASTITYGDTLADSTLLGGGASVDGSFAFTTPETAPDAGTADQSVTFTPDSEDYNTVIGTVSVLVNKATPVITWNNPADINYGTALDGIQLNATADVAGGFVYTPVSGTILNAGFGQTLSVEFTPSDIDNYEVVSKQVEINVETVELTVTAEDKSRDFGEANPEFTMIYEGFVNGDDSDDLDTEPTASSEAVIASQAGDYDITVSGGTDNNYTFKYVKGTLTVNAVVPTVTTDSVTDVTINSAKVTGTVTSDGGTVVTEKGVCIGISADPDSSCVADGSVGTAILNNFTGLDSGTTYHVRAYAKNSAGTAYGLDKSFVTIAQYMLSYSAGSNGSLTGDLEQTVEEGSDGTAVTAVADEDYHFVDWSDGVTANPRTDTNITGNISVTANFEANPVGVCAKPEEISALPYTHSTSTINRASEITNYGVNCGASEYPSSDYIYSLELKAGDGVQITLDPADDFDGVLVLLGTCAEGDCIDYANDGSVGVSEVLYYKATEDKTLFVVVEGTGVTAGDFTLEVKEWIEEADDDAVEDADVIDEDVIDADVIDEDTAVVDEDAVDEDIISIDEDIIDEDTAIVDEDTVTVDEDAVTPDEDAVTVDEDTVMTDEDAATVDEDAVTDADTDSDEKEALSLGGSGCGCNLIF